MTREPPGLWLHGPPGPPWSSAVLAWEPPGPWRQGLRGWAGRPVAPSHGGDQVEAGQPRCVAH